LHAGQRVRLGCGGQKQQNGLQEQSRA
jgi:hypothetical protein